MLSLAIMALSFWGLIGVSVVLHVFIASFSFLPVAGIC
jgi:hypothetical protein